MYLEKMKLPADKKLMEFSRGMCQKHAIISALSHRTKLLVSDEATSGLDPVIRDEIYDLFLDFVQDKDHGILVTSHITKDMERVVDYIICIHEGEVLLNTQKDKLLKNYGILKCGRSAFEALAEEDIMLYYERDYEWDVLVENREMAMRGTKNQILLPLIFAVLLVNGNLFYDRNSGREKSLVVMPVSRKNIVQSKYLLFTLTGLLALVYGVALTLIVCAIFRYPLSAYEIKGMKCEMLGLIIKDVHVIIKYRLVYMLGISVLYMILLSVLGVQNNFVIIGILFSSVEGTIGFDRSSEWEKFAITLPVSRMPVVLSKYLLSVLLMFVGIALGFIITIIVNVVFQLKILPEDLFRDMIFAIPLLLIINALVILVHLKTYRFTTAVMIIGALAIGGMYEVIRGYFELSNARFFSVLLMVSIALYTLSFFTAYLLYRRKDL